MHKINRVPYPKLILLFGKKTKKSCIVNDSYFYKIFLVKKIFHLGEIKIRPNVSQHSWWIKAKLSKPLCD